MIQLNDAQEFIKEVENKPVIYNIYCYYDKALERFNQPYVSNDDPGFIYESTMASIAKGKITVKDGGDLVLVHLGTFDLKSGEFDIFDTGKVIVDLSKIFAKENIIDA